MREVEFLVFKDPVALILGVNGRLKVAGVWVVLHQLLSKYHNRCFVHVYIHSINFTKLIQYIEFNLNSVHSVVYQCQIISIQK